MGQIAILDARLKDLLECDAHAGENGCYTIRSIYFDDYNNSCYYDNENGIDNRKKYRIRIYNCDDSRISLECKEKIHGKTVKTSCLLSLENAERFVLSHPIEDDTDYPPLLRKFNSLFITKGLHPVIIVEYDRKPYIYPAGNVRVTLDMNIRSSCDTKDFWNPLLSCRPILETGKHLLEVKFDEFIPDFIRYSLQTEYLDYTSFSKYYLCRKYRTGGQL